MTCWSQILASRVRPDLSKANPPFGFSGRRQQALNRRLTAFLNCSRQSIAQSRTARADSGRRMHSSTPEFAWALPTLSFRSRILDYIGLLWDGIVIGAQRPEC